MREKGRGMGEKKGGGGGEGGRPLFGGGGLAGFMFHVLGLFGGALPHFF